MPFQIDVTSCRSTAPLQGSLSRSYKGGFIQQLWRWQLGHAPSEAIPLTADYPGISRQPMWEPHAQRLYFLSDRSGVMKCGGRNGRNRCNGRNGDEGGNGG